MPDSMKSDLISCKEGAIRNCDGATSWEHYFELLHKEKWFLFDTIGLFIQHELNAGHGKKPWMLEACKWTQKYK